MKEMKNGKTNLFPEKKTSSQTMNAKLEKWYNAT